MKNRWLIRCVISTLVLATSALAAAELPPEVATALGRAGKNSKEIKQALDRVPAEQRRGMHFLVAYMPQRDLESLTANFLLENVRLAFQAWNNSPWKEKLPAEVFLNNVLPYASINESRDRWRADFHKRFQPLVKQAKSPAEAAAILNQKIFPLLKVRYSTKRRRADQGPYQSIETGLASCTGLSILLIDACRSVGVPARFAGTPLWSDKSGNHSWVEVWDDGWHFTGAAEPTGSELDKAWFLGRASTAKREHRLHAIYAVSFKHTPQRFPLVWDRSIDYVHAVNVTDRYTESSKKLPAGTLPIMFRVIDGGTGERLSCQLRVYDESNKMIFDGKSKDERFDSNDHVVAALPNAKSYKVEVQHGKQLITEKITVGKAKKTITIPIPKKQPKAKQDKKQQRPLASNSIDELRRFLALPRSMRPTLSKQPFSKVSLTENEAQTAEKLMWADHVTLMRASRAEEMKKRLITHGEHKMPFFYKVFGEKPAGGRSLYISLHGGGGTTHKTNSKQWENQKGLYQPKEGVYLVPRAPTDTWNLWHQGHIDEMFSRLIANMIVFEDVNPNRVYVMGYSAGGDGVYQLAPRMADRWAAAAMMAGHPNETSPLGLRNIAFTIHMGGRDGAYNRNETARIWKERLAALRAADPKGYEHLVKIYPKKGHWLNREDAVAVPWMAKHVRNPIPSRIVWMQDDVIHHRFYWLAAPVPLKPRAQVVADRRGQSIELQSKTVKQLSVRLSDRMLDLDQQVTIRFNGKEVYQGVVKRSIEVIHRTLSEYGDPDFVFSGEVSVQAKE